MNYTVCDICQVIIPRDEITRISPGGTFDTYSLCLRCATPVLKRVEKAITTSSKKSKGKIVVKKAKKQKTGH